VVTVSATEPVTPDQPAGSGEGEGEETPDPDTDPNPDPRAVTRKPTLLSRRLSLVAGVAVTLLTGLYALPGLVVGVAGVVVLWLATAEGSHKLVDLAGALLLVATVTAGTQQTPVPVTLSATVGTVVAWDVASNAVELGEQLGREPDTTGAELAHALGTVGVGAVLAGLSYAVYSVGGGGQPVGAVIALVLGTVALLSALRL
jgi:hypothetical protein